MIQSTLFFVLGFLCAGFLALLIAPPVWRRAVTMTRKRIEASVPLTLPEIQAEKDRLRAEFAMSTRRLEMSFKQFREKAAAQLIEISRNREELKGLSRDRDGKNQALTELELKVGELRSELRNREEQLQQITEKLFAAEKVLTQRKQELEKLGRMYEDASFSSSSRQIELVARESDVDRLNGDMAMLRHEHKETTRRLQELSAENQLLGEALQSERKRAADLEQTVERTLATLAAREESLELGEKELARLRAILQAGARTEDELNQQLVVAQREKLALEAEHAGLSVQMAKLLSGGEGDEPQKELERANGDRAVLEERLATLMRENRKLKDEVSARGLPKLEDGDEGSGALLREQMNDLAAEVVRLTALLEGPNSPIDKALAAPKNGASTNGTGSTVPSLADRVRALQKAAAAGVVSGPRKVVQRDR